MSVQKSHARLGAFLVVVLILAIATGLLFIPRTRDRAVLDLVTYTTENISGLDVSSPVRLRGVPVGRVIELRVDPLGKTVEINFEMFLDRLNTLGMDVARIRQTADVTRIFPNLRAQVIGSLVTGEAYLLIEVLERTEATLQVLREIISRIPNTLDRSDRFFTNVERIIRESDLPELSADSRTFFTTTTGQIGQMTSDLQAVIGP